MSVLGWGHTMDLHTISGAILALQWSPILPHPGSASRPGVYVCSSTSCSQGIQLYINHYKGPPQHTSINACYGILAIQYCCVIASTPEAVLFSIHSTPEWLLVIGTWGLGRSPHPRWRIIVLDGYDVSVLGWPVDHPLHQQAVRTLDQFNPHEVGQPLAGL